jgi:hypothetical protein
MLLPKDMLLELFTWLNTMARALQKPALQIVFQGITMTSQPKKQERRTGNGSWQPESARHYR